MTFEELTDKARAQEGLPPDWHAWKFESVLGAILCTGGCCPPITRGPSKGKPNFRKADKKTVVTVAVRK